MLYVVETKMQGGINYYTCEGKHNIITKAGKAGFEFKRIAASCVQEWYANDLIGNYILN